MSQKQTKKRKIWSILLALLCVLFYLIGCCLLPPLLKGNAKSPDVIQQMPSTSARVCVVNDNNNALLWRLRMIREAKQEIILVTFELRDDFSGRAVMAALLEAADRGVAVRVLIDGVDGALQLHGSRNFEAFLCHSNIEVKYYNPLRVTALPRINYRLHDKYLIVDETAYLMGGRNTHDVYLGSFSDDGQEDRDVVVYESGCSNPTSLSMLRSYFEKTWDMKNCVLLSSRMAVETQNQIWAKLSGHLSELLASPDYQSTPIDWQKETIQTNSIALLTGSPEAWNKAPVLWEQLCQFMEGANDIIIQTPLIICNNTMFSDLSQICKSSDLVEILTNSPESNVNLLAASYSYQKSKMLETGVIISEYCGSRALHTKTILIDDNISVIGSYNLDARSTYIDTELMIVIDCPALNADLREQMAGLRNQSRIVALDGTVSYGSMFIPKEMSFGKKCLNAILSVVLFPFQYLL